VNSSAELPKTVSASVTAAEKDVMKKLITRITDTNIRHHKRL
jgi:hypothetical protein